MKKYIIIAAVLFFGNSWAKENVNGNTSTPTPLSAPTGVDCNRSSSSSSLDINNVRARILNGGDMWWDQGGTGNARYEVPKLNDPTQIKKNSMFAGSVWIGGTSTPDESSNVYVTAQTYRQGKYAYWPGPLVATTTELPSIQQNECAFWDKHFKVNKSDIDAFVEAFTNGDIQGEDDIHESILQWPGKANPYMDDEDGAIDLNVELAPFVDVDKDGNYDPLKGDYPEINGDQAIWWVMNDVGDEKEYNSEFYSLNDLAIGLELKTMAFAFQTNDEINNMTFYKQTMTNKGNRTLYNTYLGQWVDPDLGNFVDDYVGCDVTRGLGICYNGDDDDDGILGYGLNPPAVGVDFFSGPLADLNDGLDNDRDGLTDEGSDGIDNNGDGNVDEDSEREKIVMSNFLYYNNNANPVNGNPTLPSDHYNYLKSKWRNGDNVMYDGGDGTDQSADYEAKFMFPGTTDQELYWGTDGNAVDPWDEVSAGNAPADRRFLQSAGPFTLEPGQVNDVTVGVIWMRAGSGGATGSIAALKVADDKAQELFDDNFKNLQGPNPPEVAVTELDQQIVLAFTPSEFLINGERQNTETYREKKQSFEEAGQDDAFFRFQGYLVYQLANASVSASELDNTDNARLIAQCDIQDGVSALINKEDNPFGDPNATSPVQIDVLKVSGADEGVFHTMTVTTDEFTSGNEIVNNKEYYFMVLAYASNTDPKNDRQQFISSQKDIKVITAIPHLTSFAEGGVILNASYGTGVDIRAINGTGTGGVSVDYTKSTIDQILSSNSIEQPVYAGGNAPISVKVYDPVSVKPGSFKVKLYSRLLMELDGASAFNVGDTLIAIDTGGSIEPSRFDNDEIAGKGYIKEILDTIEISYDSSYIKTTPERTDTIFNPNLPGTITNVTPVFADSLVSVDTVFTIDTTATPPDTTVSYDSNYVQIVVDYDTTELNGAFVYNTHPAFSEEITVTNIKKAVQMKVVMMNDKEGGTFSKHFVDINEITDFSNPDNVVTRDIYQGYSTLDLPFEDVTDPSKKAKSLGFQLHEYFEIENENGVVQDAEKHYRVSEFNEILIRKGNEKIGVSLQMKHGYDPEFEVIERSDNAFIEAEYNVTSGADWLLPVPFDPVGVEGVNWQKEPIDAGDIEATTTDPGNVYSYVANGSIAPYNNSLEMSTSITKAGGRYSGSISSTPNSELPNVNIVIDYDNPSNWTRVPVLQINFRDDASGAVLNDSRYMLSKSDVPSVGTNGVADGTTSPYPGFGPSKGMGWFPGYAIDLDRGIRLNLMFSESKIADPTNGNNLVWEPTNEDDGGRSFIYVTNTEYDPTYYENLFDDAEVNRYNVINDVAGVPGYASRLKDIFKDVTWLVNPRRSSSQLVGSGNYNIRIRVNHYFKTTKEGNYIPEYGFSTDAYVPQIGDNKYQESVVRLD